MGENDPIPVDPDFAGDIRRWIGSHWRVKPLHVAGMLWVAVLLLTPNANAQAVRFDTDVTTVSAQCVSGKQCPVLSLPGTIVSVCGGSVSTLASCLAAPATTYTDFSAGTPCPTTAQLTPSTGGACLSTADAEGNAGFWALPGQYNYFLRVPATAGGGTYGPYPVNVGASAGCPLGATCDASFSTLPLACTAAGTGTLYLTRTWSGLTTQTLACNIQALANGIIKPASGQTVTLSKSFDGTPTQHFDISSGGTITLTGPVTRVYPNWWGADPTGVSDSATAITAAAHAVPGGAQVYFPVGTYLMGAVTSADRVVIMCESPAVNLRPSSNSETMLLLSNVGAGGVRNCTFNANSKTGVTGIELNGSSNNIVDQNYFTGAFAQPIWVTNLSFFNSISNNGMHLVVAGILIDGQSNVNTITGNSIFLNGSFGAGITIHNGDSYKVSGNDFECGSTFSTFNTFGIDLSANHFETSGSGCPTGGTQWIGIGTTSGGAEANGITIKNNFIGSNVNYAVGIAKGSAIDFEDNYIATDLDGVVIYTQNDAGGNPTLKSQIHGIGNNKWNIGGAGDDPSKYVTFNGGYTNSVNSNVTSTQWNPILFPSGMPFPQTAHVPNTGSLALALNSSGYLQTVYNTGSGFETSFRIQDMNCHPSLLNTKCTVSGALQVTPWSGTNTDPVQQVFDNNHRVYIGENGSGSSQRFCGSSTDYAAVLCTNDVLPVEIGTGNTIRFKVTPQGTNLVPGTVASLPACPATAVEGTMVPVTDANSATFNAAVASGGSNHIIAFCNGSGWVIH